MIIMSMNMRTMSEIVLNLTIKTSNKIRWNGNFAIGVHCDKIVIEMDHILKCLLLRRKDRLK